MNLNSNNQEKTQVNTDERNIETRSVVDAFVPAQSNKGTIKFSGGAAHWSRQ